MKHLIKSSITFLMFLFLVDSISFAQEEQQIPPEFFTGRWAGNITGILRSEYPGPPFDEKHNYPFTIRLRGHPGKYGSAVMKISASGPGSFTFVDSNATCGFTYYRGTFSIMSNALNEEMGTSLKGRTVMTFVSFLTAGMSAELENENTIKLKFITEDDDFFGSGTLYRVNLERETIGETIKINEPVKTDNKTQKEIIIPDVGEFTLDKNSECKFTDKTDIELFKGKIRAKVRDLSEYELKILTPQAVIGVRGTEFITEFKEGKGTTLTVIEGEVEIYDKNQKKTVIAQKNQKVTLKDGELLSEPTSINPEHIFRWWK